MIGIINKVPIVNNTAVNSDMNDIVHKVPVSGKDTLNISPYIISNTNNQVPIVNIANTVVQKIVVDTPDIKNTRANVGEVNEKKLNEEVIYVSEYNGINYLFTKDEVKPYSKWAKDVNTLLSNYTTTIKTIIPHYFMNDVDFKTRLIIILEDDFYAIVEDDKLQPTKDWVKDMNFGFSTNLQQVYNCNQNKNILEQMVKVGVITNDKKTQLLNKLKCQ